jgi:dipeptidyl aminopeptidase/acylaminoacyl peptidase
VDVQTGGEVALVRVALDGDESHAIVAGGTRACTPLALRGRKVLFAAFGFTDPGDLYVADLETGAEDRLTRLNDDLLAELALPTIIPLHFTSIDGSPVEGWFLQPADSSPPLPTILSIHGGPHGAWGASFHFDHLICSRERNARWPSDQNKSNSSRIIGTDADPTRESDPPVLEPN